VSTRPARLPHPWGATSCREAAPITYTVRATRRGCAERANEGPADADTVRAGMGVQVLVHAVHEAIVAHHDAGPLPDCRERRSKFAHGES